MRHPRLLLSTWWRLALGDLITLSLLGLSEAVLFHFLGPLLAFGPIGLLTFYWLFIPTDANGTRCRLVHYFLVSVVFTMPINSTGVRSHLLCAIALEHSLSVSPLAGAFRLWALPLHGSY
jgi:hypothetical protein